jgi:putative ABC transport system permease protein
MRGDLLEEWRARGASRAASVWYWRHALALAARYAWRERHMEPASAGDRSTRMFLDNLRQDLRFALRSYAKAPSFTLAILTTLALGIGASTAIFSMVNAIILRPLPFPDPDRLVFASELSPDGSSMSVSWPNYLDWRARARSFEGLASSRNELLMLTGVETAQRLEARRVTGNFLDVLGVRPAIGRGFSDADDRPGADPVVVLSDGFWRSQLGASTGVLGTRLMLDGTPHTIVGVLPPGFRYVRTYALFASMGPHMDKLYARSRGDHAGHYVVGRLKQGVTLQSAALELQRIERDLEREHPDTNSHVSAGLELLASRIVTDVRSTLLVLLGAVGFLLLIACVNVANLLIARGAARQHELAVRAALGGGRLRLASQLLTESALVSSAGGLIGVVLAAWLLRLLVAVAPEGTPRLDQVQLDRAAVLFALAATTVCGILFGAFPAFQASSAGGQQVVVRERRSGGTAASHRLRRGLMVVEVAVALVLLTGAGLMVQTLRHLTLVDTGFRSDHVLTLRTSLRGERWNQDRRILFFDDLRSRIKALPGVSDAALVSALPVDGSDWNSFFIAAGKPVPARTELPGAAMTSVSVGYFETMGTRLVRGRLFTTGDVRQSTPAIVVNESLARTIFPNEDAIGQRLKQGWPEMPGTWREIVGVVADVKFEGVSERTPMQVYMPMTQETPRDVAIVVRSRGPAESLQAPVEAIVRSIDRDLPIYAVRTMERVIETSMARERMGVLVLTVFAVLAVTLASVGLYGVVAHGVTERTHEIGVRMALGADTTDVVKLVVGQGVIAAVAGLTIGVGAALAFARTMQGLLFGVTATDPVTFGGVVAVLLGVALVACYVPAWRATRIDPTTALRSE